MLAGKGRAFRCSSDEGRISQCHAVGGRERKPLASDFYSACWMDSEGGRCQLGDERSGSIMNQVQTCFCGPCDAAALQQLTGRISESLGEG